MDLIYGGTSFLPLFLLYFIKVYDIFIANFWLESERQQAVSKA